MPKQINNAEQATSPSDIQRVNQLLARLNGQAAPKSKEKAANELFELAKNPQSEKLFSHTENAIQQLTSLLRSTQNSALIGAIVQLLSILSTYTHHQDAMIRTGVIPELIALLSVNNKDAPLALKIASTLKCLAESAEAATQLIQGGVIQALLDRLKMSHMVDKDLNIAMDNNESATEHGLFCEHAAYIIGGLTSDADARAQIIAAQGIERLAYLLDISSSGLKIVLLTALKQLAKYEDSRPQIAKTLEVVRLLEFLNLNNALLSCCAMQTIQALLSDLNTHAQCFERETFTVVLAHLKSPNLALKLEISKTIKMLAQEFNRENHAKMLQAGVIGNLKPLIFTNPQLNKEQSAIRIEALSSIYYLARTQQARLEIINQKVILKLAPLLNDEGSIQLKQVAASIICMPTQSAHTHEALIQINKAKCTIPLLKLLYPTITMREKLRILIAKTIGLLAQTPRIHKQLIKADAITLMTTLSNSSDNTLKEPLNTIIEDIKNKRPSNQKRTASQDTLATNPQTLMPQKRSRKEHTKDQESKSQQAAEKSPKQQSSIGLN